MLTAPPNLYRWQDEKQTPVALVPEKTQKFAIHNSLILFYLILSISSAAALEIPIIGKWKAT